MRQTFIIALALVGITLPSAVAAQRPNPRPEQRVYVHREELREQQRETIKKTVRLGRSGTLDVSNLSGDITITRGGGTDATIDVTKIARGRTEEDAREVLSLVKVEINERGDRVEARTVYPERGTWGPRRNISVTVHYVISAPEGTRVTARSISGNVKATDIRGELSLTTTSGNVHIANAARVSAAKSTSGNVEITNMESDIALEASTISGNVVVRTVKARRMDLGTVSGNVIMHNVNTERMDAKSLSGDVEFQGELARGGRYELKSHSGNVRASVQTSGFEVEASSWSGEVRTDFTVEGTTQASSRVGRRKSIRGVVGDGGAVLNVTTFSGDVSILKR